MQPDTMEDNMAKTKPKPPVKPTTGGGKGGKGGKY